MDSIYAIDHIEGQARRAAARHPGQPAQCPYPHESGAARVWLHFFEEEQALYASVGAPTHPSPRQPPCKNPS